MAKCAFCGQENTRYVNGVAMRLECDCKQLEVSKKITQTPRQQSTRRLSPTVRTVFHSLRRH